jgi:hypothetical protein
MGNVKRLVSVILFLLLVPTWAAAQGLGTIAGSVKDASGAVLPGVTVEVASPALIEKTRTAVTNESGQYTVVSLPPGTYSVTFTLPGFSTTKRDGIEMLANFTAQINAEMKVGGVAETVEVTAVSPLVDTQSSAVARAVTRDMIKEIPTGGTMYQLAAMMVGVNMGGGAATVDVGGASGSPVQAQLSAHGGAPGDEVQMIDGIKVGNMMSSGGRTNQTLSPLLFEQIDVQVSGHAGDAPTVGVQSNLIPRTGGNEFHGTFLVNGSYHGLQSNNLTQRLKDKGLTDTTRIKNLYDINGGFGGPIMKDRLWFFATGRYQTNTSYLPGLYFAVDPKSWVRTEDKSRQGFDDQFLWDYTTRLTAAITSSMRLNGFIQIQHKWWPHWAINALTSPEAVGRVDWPGRLYQLSWNWTASSKLLFEAGTNYGDSSDTILPRPGEVNGLGAPFRIVEQGGPLPNGQSVAPITYGKFGPTVYETPMHQYGSRASMSYVTGAHDFKVGMDLQRGFRNRTSANFGDDIAYRTQSFVLNQVTIYAPSGAYRSNLNYNLGLYVQDRWRIGRVSVSPGVRFEFQKESNDAYWAQSTKYLPNRSLAFTGADVTHWKDVNPRIGVSYDLFGNGRTAVKASAARGVQQDNINIADSVHPAVALATSVARNVDERTFPEGDPRRLNNFPDCDLFNPAVNGECGAWLTSGFGGTIPVTQRDPRTLGDWNVRPWNWEFSTGFQHELARRVSAGMSYYRRVNGNFLVQDNTANTAADFKEFTVTVPTDSRLPTSGQKLTVYDINPVLTDGRPFSTTSNVIKPASDYGHQFLHWDGFDINSNVRLQKITFQGGVTFGKTMSDNCEIVKQLPEVLTNAISVTAGNPYSPAAVNFPREFCHNETGWQPTWKMIGSYDVPWQNIRFSSNFQSLPGPGLQAGVIYSSADLTAALGRGLSGGGNKTVNVFDPNTAFGDRLYQVDFRFTKIFKVNERNTVDANFDIYNALNSDAATAENQTYTTPGGGLWRRPTGVIQGRIFKFGMRWDF